MIHPSYSPPLHRMWNAEMWSHFDIKHLESWFVNTGKWLLDICSDNLTTTCLNCSIHTLYMLRIVANALHTIFISLLNVKQIYQKQGYNAEVRLSAINHYPIFIFSFFFFFFFFFGGGGGIDGLTLLFDGNLIPMYDMITNSYTRPFVQRYIMCILWNGPMNLFLG